MSQTTIAVDADKELARLYRARTAPELVTVPELGFVMIDGHGDPNAAPEYADALQALYSLSYGLKFALRKELGVEARVGPPEGLWWAQDMREWSMECKADWDWTMMIRQHDAVTPELFGTVRAQVAAKKELPALPLARLERFCEGRCAQILHVGPYSTECQTILALHAFIYDAGFEFDGVHEKHHEIYLSDPRRTAPERLKTIIRQPFTD
jgi:hypothetical protein